MEKIVGSNWVFEIRGHSNSKKETIRLIVIGQCENVQGKIQ